jgi:transposase
MNPYSEQVRKRIIEVLAVGKESQTETAAVFGVSLSFVQKLWRRWRETGSYSVKPRGSARKPRTLKDYEAAIRAAVAAHPKATLAELCEVIKAAGGPSVPGYTMGRELKRLKLSLTRTGPRVRTRILQAEDEAKIRVVAETHSNATLAELCEAFKDAGGPSVSPQTMRRALNRLKLRPPSQGRRGDRILKDYEAEIRTAVAAHPNATLAELCELVKAAGGPSVPGYTLGRELRRLRLPHKSIARKPPQLASQGSSKI